MPKALPARPNIEHLKSQAKDLLDAYEHGDPEALARFRANLPGAHKTESFALHDAQSVIAREYGFASFAELREHVDSLPLRDLTKAHLNAPLPAQLFEALGSLAMRAEQPSPIDRSTTLPLIPLRNAMLTVGANAPINIGRPASIAAADSARAKDDLVVVFSQRDASNESPVLGDLHPIGCIAQILTTMEVREHGTFIVVRGAQWVKLEAIEQGATCSMARVTPFAIEGDERSVATETKVLREKAEALASAMPNGDRLRAMIQNMNALALADAIVANVPVSVEDKARYASESTLAGRLRCALAILNPPLS